MKKTFLFLSLSTFIITSCNNGGGDVALVTSNDSLSYALGVNMGIGLSKDIEQQEGMDTIIDMSKLLAGFKVAIDTGDTELLISEEEAGKIIGAYVNAQRAKQMAEERKKYESNVGLGEKFLAENGKKQGVTTTASGLQYEILKKGNGPKPTAESVVETHYHGTFLDGKVFDSSVERGKPVEFPLNRVIPGWTEVLQLMPVGSKWKVWIPYNLAYGEAGNQGVPPFSTLVFEIELISIKK